MKRNGVMPLAIIGFIVISFTLAVFFLLEIQRIPVNIWALVFLLVSECAMFGGLIGLRFTKVNEKNIFLKAGIPTVLSLYLSASLIVIFFTQFYKDKINVFILIELAIIAFFAIAATMIIAWSRRIIDRNSEDIEKVGSGEPKRGGF